MALPASGLLCSRCPRPNVCVVGGNSPPGGGGGPCPTRRRCTSHPLAPTSSAAVGSGGGPGRRKGRTNAAASWTHERGGVLDAVRRAALAVPAACAPRAAGPRPGRGRRRGCCAPRCGRGVPVTAHHGRRRRWRTASGRAPWTTRAGAGAGDRSPSPRAPPSPRTARRREAWAASARVARLARPELLVRPLGLHRLGEDARPHARGEGEALPQPGEGREPVDAARRVTHLPAVIRMAAERSRHNRNLNTVPLPSPPRPRSAHPFLRRLRHTSSHTHPPRVARPREPRPLVHRPRQPPRRLPSTRHAPDPTPSPWATSPCCARPPMPRAP